MKGPPSTQQSLMTMLLSLLLLILVVSLPSKLPLWGPGQRVRGLGLVVELWRVPQVHVAGLRAGQSLLTQGP